MERYSKYFVQQGFDGNMLLMDVDEGILTSNLGDRRIHAKKIMRVLLEVLKRQQALKHQQVLSINQHQKLYY